MSGVAPRPYRQRRRAADAARTRKRLIAATRRLTLARGAPTVDAIAAAADVSVQTLYAHFGSKRALLLEVTRRAAGGTADYLERIRAEHESPLEALYAYAACFAAMAESPETLAHHLAYLQLDLTDPDFLRSARGQARVGDRAIRELIEEAVGQGELARATDVEGVARAVIAVLGGSLLAWAIRQEGTAEHWMRADLDAVLAPYRSRSGRGDGRLRGPRGGAASSPRAGSSRSAR